MITKEHRERLKQALQSDNHPTAVYRLARALREEGMGQLDMYLLFSEFQQACDPGDPRYDSIVDTMDLIYGGPWAKGHGFFDQELKQEDIDEARRQQRH